MLALVALGCAAPGTRDGDSAPLPSASVSAPTEKQVVAEPAGPGDAPPNHADNNGWKQRHELTADEQRTGDRLAGRIRPKLAALRKAGDFAPASTRQALLDLGIRADSVEVTAMRPAIGEETPSPGAVYAVRFPDAGCIVGDVRPDRLLVEVTGAAAEFGCLEPFSH
ncbi:hypothetical protein AB0368_28780 [Actinoplanes sp. NPDC051475]|uniref:DUF6993 domain-containing protein n=1 Tax=Actinoplanes sp. NPDC051475 TaxID=3157225 RepID=UPI00344D6D6A